MAVSGAALSCGAQAQGVQTSVAAAPGSRAPAQSLWPSAFVAPPHMGSPQTRDRTCVSCTGRQVLYHEATREALSSSLSVIWANLVTESCKEAILEFCAHLEASRYQ